MAAQTDNLKKMKLRFAPSPTGFLHVGGARTAIFNWLLARKYGASFLLRIEDTDRTRSTLEAEKQILSALQQLGIDWDGEPYYQSRHRDRHIQAAQQLLDSGLAYRCFCTKEELAEKRRQAEINKINQRYDGTCRNLPQSVIEKKLTDGKPFSIRFKVEPGQVSWIDEIHGETRVGNNTLDDFIIVREDGTPTYQLAVVTDDHDMGITLVLRGDDHIANTNKQILLYKALGWPVPRFGHIPLILGPDKVRLSKRHGAASVGAFMEQGILPEALFNYLCLLGWSPGDDREIMSREELIDAFEISRINHSAAVFDLKKLFWLNGRYLAELPFENVWKYVQDWLKEQGQKIEKSESAQFRLLVSLQQVRAESLIEITNGLGIFFDAPQVYEEKGVRKFFLKGNAKELLEGLKKEIDQKDEAFFSDVESIETFIRDFAAQQETAAAKVIHPLRLALTGSSASPGIFELLYILGKEKTTARIENALHFISTAGNTVQS